MPAGTRIRCNASRPEKSTSSPDRRSDAQLIAGIDSSQILSAT
ncbi:hypothetical protein L841_1652 [Mycobacterium sp. MAC_080597_8934]|nr:hypothetical protein L839_4438 [Mycobacterium avium MAV_120809_2495]ETZ42654.1 hypothetical protein L837_4905 [Mycobacterium avium MAV_061107_1842]ETZ55374.1 hypothetical protein L840_4096 [Mycobacterium sp. MAC_011194_8550]ETZ68799.1 hypothetical protein L841_1652 [Mycobacterium sp. MAC_080597_8934]